MNGFKATVVAVKTGYAMKCADGVGYLPGREVTVTVSDGSETRTITGRQLVAARETDQVYCRLHQEAEMMLRRNKMAREIDTETGAAID